LARRLRRTAQPETVHRCGPDWLSDRFERLQNGLKLRRLIFHGLRHTSATIALLKGVPVHVVCERLGHSKVSTTLDVYAHVIRTQASDAAQVIGGAIYGDDAEAAEGGG
jgi:integrase